MDSNSCPIHRESVFGVKSMLYCESIVVPPSMAYTVYGVAYVGMPRAYHAIFIAHNEDHSGSTSQVMGNIQGGKTFEKNGAKEPDSFASFESTT